MILLTSISVMGEFSLHVYRPIINTFGNQIRSSLSRHCEWLLILFVLKTISSFSFCTRCYQIPTASTQHSTTTMHYMGVIDRVFEFNQTFHWYSVVLSLEIRRFISRKHEENNRHPLAGPDCACDEWYTRTIIMNSIWSVAVYR